MCLLCCWVKMCMIEKKDYVEIVLEFVGILKFGGVCFEIKFLLCF